MPANIRPLELGVLNANERARIVVHLTEQYGDVSKGLRALVNADLVAHGANPLPPLRHGGRQMPIVWAWPGADRSHNVIYCKYTDHPLHETGEWNEFIDEVTEEDDPELYQLAVNEPDVLLKLRRDKAGAWKIVK